MSEITARRVETCTDDELWEYELSVAVSDDIVDAPAPVGNLERPIMDKPLYRLETDQFVLLATIGKRRIRLRIKSSCESQTVKRRIDASLRDFLEAIEDGGA